jgi:hypothetical protein
MKRVPCRDCGEEHDLEDLEPSYGLPDEVFALSEAERAQRVEHGRNFCELRGEGSEHSRWFLRTLVAFSVEDRDDAVRWGIWVELTAAAFNEIQELWEDSTQLSRGPWSATLANAAATYPSTLGLTGLVRFTDLKRVPEFSPSPEQEHLFVEEWKSGVSEQRVLEWLHDRIHDRRHPDSSDADEGENSPRMVDCAKHGRSLAAVVCVHLLEAQERAVGFIENSSESGDLQAWCDECEDQFEREGSLTAAFKEFCDIRIVCEHCYVTISERHSPLE